MSFRIYLWCQVSPDLPSTSCGTSCFPVETSCVCFQVWGPWHGTENHRDRRIHHGPLLISEAPGGAGEARGCVPWSGGTPVLPEPASEISAREQCLGVLRTPVCVSFQTRQRLTCFCPWLSPAFPLLIWFKILIWYCLKATLLSYFPASPV